MSQKEMVTEKTIRQFVSHVGNRRHAMAGAVIATAAAEAAALGEACLRISRGELMAAQERATAEGAIETVQSARRQLLTLCDEDAGAIGVLAGQPTVQDEMAIRHLLCQLPGEIGVAAATVATALQEFRPLICERVQDDLEMAIVLLVGAARGAMLLLDSNLRIWPDPDLIDKHEPRRAALEERIAQLMPVSRIRQNEEEKEN